MKLRFTLTDYIEIKGANAVAEELGVTPTTVFNWKRLDFAPSPLVAGALVRLSNNVLSYDAIYAPYVDKALGRKQAKDETGPEQLSLDELL